MLSISVALVENTAFLQGIRPVSFMRIGLDNSRNKSTQEPPENVHSNDSLWIRHIMLLLTCFRHRNYKVIKNPVF